MRGGQHGGGKRYVCAFLLMRCFPPRNDYKTSTLAGRALNLFAQCGCGRNNDRACYTVADVRNAAAASRSEAEELTLRNHQQVRGTAACG